MSANGLLQHATSTIAHKIRIGNSSPKKKWEKVSNNEIKNKWPLSHATDGYISQYGMTPTVHWSN